MAYSDAAINAQVREEAVFFRKIESEVAKVVVGQRRMIERLLIALLSNEHVLLEGAPGLAKTLTIKTLADVMDLEFRRIQFTPDLLPSDLIGTVIYDHAKGDFVAKRGPIFGNIVLADEINRSPAKVQSALLQAMQERQVTLGGETLALDNPFLVLATQNPIELEGTYALPEAQLDRFMLKVNITYPEADEEKLIMERMSSVSGDYNPFLLHEHGERVEEAPGIVVERVIKPEEILKARKVVDSIRIEDSIKSYIVEIVRLTREPGRFGMGDIVEYGASPRATIFLNKAARSRAFLAGRGYVLPEDVQEMVSDVLRHRIILSYKGEAEGVTAEDVISEIIDRVEVP
ncbi:MAG TPA: MoxR family ATPase [Deltaproteobacteria bacterium]|nr:MoxR family ATPase [Deltaproteobacteria bacterium]